VGIANIKIDFPSLGSSTQRWPLHPPLVDGSSVDLERNEMIHGGGFGESRTLSSHLFDAHRGSGELEMGAQRRHPVAHSHRPT